MVPGTAIDCMREIFQVVQTSCFAGRRKVIFVHGCFWHRHEGCKRTTTPRVRREFWETKFADNRKRNVRRGIVLGTRRLGSRNRVGVRNQPP